MAGLMNLKYPGSGSAYLAPARTVFYAFLCTFIPPEARDGAEGCPPSRKYQAEVQFQ